MGQQLLRPNDLLAPFCKGSDTGAGREFRPRITLNPLRENHLTQFEANTAANHDLGDCGGIVAACADPGRWLSRPS